MIFGHDYMPFPGIIIPGPPTHPIGSVTPKSLADWAVIQGQTGPLPNATQIAGERRIRAYGHGHGSQRWDPHTSAKMPPGWLRDKDERAQVCVELLQDINDMVCAILMACDLVPVLN